LLVRGAPAPEAGYIVENGRRLTMTRSLHAVAAAWVLAAPAGAAVNLLHNPTFDSDLWPAPHRAMPTR
jgi:hypothetical protein